MPPTIIHVDGPRLKTNRETGANAPVIRIVEGDHAIWAMRVAIEGPCTIIQRGPDRALEGYPNATTWIETTAPIRAWGLEGTFPARGSRARRRRKDLDQRTQAR